MNIDEADQTLSLISETNTDYLIDQFLIAKSFHFHNEKTPLHMTFKHCFARKRNGEIFVFLSYSVIHNVNFTKMICKSIPHLLNIF